MKNDRLFQLVYLLLEKGTMTATELSSALEVSVRTIYRDVETLSMAGIPVYSSVGKGGGISLLPGYTFDKALLSNDEQNQLLFAIQSLKATNQNVDILLQKLGATFQKSASNWIEVDFSRWGMQRTDTEKFESIKNAILSKQVLQFTYYGTSGQKTQRRVHPLKLIYKDKNWYLQAFCLRAADFRLFKVGRIMKVEPLQENFAQTYEGEIPPLELENPPYLSTHLTLRIAESLAFRVYDEFDLNAISTQPDGSFLVEVDFPMDSWVVAYLFSFGTALDVLEPVELRKQLAEYAQEIVKHHRI